MHRSMKQVTEPPCLSAPVDAATIFASQQGNLSNQPDIAHHEEACVKHREKILDEALETTFPASDAVSLSDSIT